MDKGKLKKIIDFKIFETQALEMIKEVISDEVRKVLFVMDNNKALGPNGFGVFFSLRGIGTFLGRMLLKLSRISLLQVGCLKN